MKIATVLFAYNRPKYLKKVLASINRKIDFVFVDYSIKQAEIINMLHGKALNIYPRETHYGLADNVINGFTEVYKLGYDATIFLVDDIIIKNENFFNVMEMNLHKYRYKNIGSVTTHCIQKHNYKRFVDWGFGTWKEVWDKVDWSFKNKIDEGFGKIGSDLPMMYKRAREGKIDSWAVRFAYHCYKNNLLCIHPQKSTMLKHIGKKGTHFNLLSRFGIRKHLRKIDYYKDKDILMKLEN